MFTTIKEHVTENALAYALGTTATLSGALLGYNWLQNRRAQRDAEAFVKASGEKLKSRRVAPKAQECIEHNPCPDPDYDYSPMRLSHDLREAMQGLEFMKAKGYEKYMDESETDYRQFALIFFYIIINRPWIHCSKLTPRQLKVIQNLAREYVEYVEPLESYSKKECELAIDEITRRISAFIIQNHRNANPN